MTRILCNHDAVAMRNGICECGERFPDMLGFEQRSGHDATLTSADTSKTFQRPHVACSCGWEHSYYTKIDGTADARSVRSWFDHLELAEADPNQILHLGHIQRKRSAYDVIIVHCDHPNVADLLATTNSHHAHFLTKAELGRKYWLVIKQGKQGTWKLDNSSMSQRGAIDRARRIFIYEQRNGSTVETDLTAADVAPVVLSVDASLAWLIERVSEAVDTGNVGQLLETLDHVDGLLSQMPLLKEARQRISDQLLNRSRASA